MHSVLEMFSGWYAIQIHSLTHLLTSASASADAMLHVFVMRSKDVTTHHNVVIVWHFCRLYFHTYRRAFVSTRCLLSVAPCRWCLFRFGADSFFRATARRNVYASSRRTESTWHNMADACMSRSAFCPAIRRLVKHGTESALCRHWDVR